MALFSVLILGSKNVLKKWIFLPGFGPCVRFLRWLKPHGCLVVSRVGTTVKSWVMGVSFVLWQGSGPYVHWHLTSFCSLFNEEPMKRHLVSVWATRPWRQTCPLCGESHVMVLCSAVTVLLAFARRWECRSAPIKNNDSGPAQFGTGCINLMKVVWAGMAELMIRWLRECFFTKRSH